MAVKYLTHQIMEVTHTETGEKWHELSHWYTSDKSPDIAGKRLIGYFKTSQEAENAHMKQALIDKFYPENIEL